MRTPVGSRLEQRQLCGLCQATTMANSGPAFWAAPTESPPTASSQTRPLGECQSFAIYYPSPLRRACVPYQCTVLGFGLGQGSGPARRRSAALRPHVAVRWVSCCYRNPPIGRTVPVLAARSLSTTHVYRSIVTKQSLTFYGQIPLAQPRTSRYVRLLVRIPKSRPSSNA